MITSHTCIGDGKGTLINDDAAGLPPDTVWVDIFDADAAEVAFIEKVTGLHVPSSAELGEIESSSRLRVEKNTLYLSMPLVYAMETGLPVTTSVGFVLRKDLLITVRFADLRVFRNFTDAVALSGAIHHSSAGAFVGLLEAIIDRMADGLERVGADLDSISNRIFRNELKEKRHRPAKEDADLREVLRRIGRDGDLTSKIRDTLLGLGRIVSYVMNLGTEWLVPEVRAHLETVRRDVTSLNDYDAQMTNNVQLLLDATLGLINIEQNNIIKIMSVAAMVFLPPTLFASIWGMNFKYMPDLNSPWGYPLALIIMVFSAVRPYYYFKRRGWL